MKRIINLGLVGILMNACTYEGDTIINEGDSGSSDGGGYFTDSDGNPTSEEFYLNDAQGNDLINFQNGLQSSGFLPYIGFLSWDEEYFDVVEFDPDKSELDFIGNSHGPWWDSENSISMFPYSPSVVEDLTWAYSTLSCDNVEDENGDVDADEFNDILNRYMNDCGDRLMVTQEQGTGKFMLYFAFAPEDRPDTPSRNDLVDLYCAFSGPDYCGRD